MVSQHFIGVITCYNSSTGVRGGLYCRGILSRAMLAEAVGPADIIAEASTCLARRRRAS